LQVIYLVIGGISVFMVNNLVVGQFPSEVFFYDEAVFPDTLSINSNHYATFSCGSSFEMSTPSPPTVPFATMALGRRSGLEAELLKPMGYSFPLDTA
jgi:hypothetical protein